ncbi:MAG: hypothetical protein RJA07_2282 [Bacteroidota bacterium]|jgi:hypothetical protein
MKKQKIFFIASLIFVLLSLICFASNKISLNHKIFRSGPMINSAKLEILTPCDCCAGLFIFISDSEFVKTSLCLNGDVYSKGKYKIFSSNIEFDFSGESVTKIDKMILTGDTTAWNKDTIFFEKIKPTAEKRAIVFLKSKMILAIDYEPTNHDPMDKSHFNYAMEIDWIKYDAEIAELRKDGIFKQLKLSLK